MGKGSNTTSTTSTSAPNPQAAAAYSDVLNRASGVAATPYQAYSGELTAPVNSQQQAGIAGINNNASFASPFIQNASQQAAGASAPITPQQIQSYLNPYTQNVVDTTNAQLTHDNGVQMAGLQGNQISQGALGGNATGVAKAILAGQQGRTMASTDAGLYQQGYGQALSAAQQQQQTGLAGANAQANYGISGQNALLSGAGQQINAGSLQQQTQQAQDTANYGQYAQAQAFPYQQTQWLAGIDTGVGSNLGGTSYGTTVGPPPNQTAQYLGAGVAAAGLFLNRGGAVHRYSGGGVAQPFMRMAGGGAPGAQPWGGVAPSWIPQMNIHGGSGAPQAHAPSSSSTAVPAVDFTKLASGISGLQDKNASGQLGQLFNPEAYGNTFGGGSGISGGSGSSPLPGLDASDYGAGYARGGGVAGYAGGGAPSFDDRYDAAFPARSNGVAEWSDPQPMFGEGQPQLPPGASFEERSAPAREAIAKGDFDPRGANSTEFRGGPAMEASNRGIAPLPRPRPEGSGVPVEAADDDEEDAPVGIAKRAGVAPPGGATAFAPTGPSSYSEMPDAVTQPKRDGFGLGLISPNAKTGLLAAGLGMLSSRSPFLGNAIGEGGQAGLSAYGAANLHDEQVAAEAAKLSREARQKFVDTTLKAESQAETSRHNKATEAKEFKPTFGVIREDPDPDSGIMRKVYGWIDPNTKKAVPESTAPAGAPPPAPKVDAQGLPLTGQAYLDTLSPNRATLAKQIADYKVNPTGLSIRGGHREQAIADATRYNPDYDQRVYTGSNRAMSNFMGGPEGRTVRSLNVAIDHLNTLDEAGKALQNGDYPKLNQIVNYFRQQTGNPVTTNFDSIKQVVSAEIAKAVVGGQTALHDRDDMAQRASAAAAPAQIAGIIGEFKKLMAGQMNGLRKQYEVTTRAKNFDDYLEPATKKELSALGHVKPNWSGGGEESPQVGGFAPPPGAIPRMFNGKTYYYDPNTKQPYPGQ